MPENTTNPEEKPEKPDDSEDPSGNTDSTNPKKRNPETEGYDSGLPDEISAPGDAENEEISFRQGSEEFVLPDDLQKLSPEPGDAESEASGSSETVSDIEEIRPASSPESDDSSESRSETGEIRNEETVAGTQSNDADAGLPENARQGGDAGMPGSIPPAARQRSGESDNRISLIDRNNLQIVVSTKKGVRIFTSVTDRADKAEVQGDEIFLPPRTDYGLQEAEITISIQEKPGWETAAEPGLEGRFVPKLIDEYQQKIRFAIYYGESVRIDYDFRDKKTLANAKRYKNYLSPRTEQDIYDVEVSINIEASEPELLKATDKEGNVALIPNPEVAELIQPPVPVPDYSLGGLIEGGVYKNPFDSLRALLRRNLSIGITVAVILHLAAAGFAYFNLQKQNKAEGQEEPQRLIVIQDLPDPKIRIENIEDPYKPPPADETAVQIPKREPPRRVVQPPKVTRPRDTEEPKDTNTSALNRELDSLRRLGDSLMASDTSRADTSAAFFDIPDSLRNNFSEKDLGLGMYFPNKWKLIDEREINRNETQFRGVLLTDTTAEQPGTMTIFIHLDNESKGFNSEEFTTEFTMLDTNLSAFSKPPVTQAAHTKYEFYIFNNLGTEKLSVKAEVRKEFFDNYKNEIEAVVRSINIRKPGEPEPGEENSAEEN